MTQPLAFASTLQRLENWLAQKIPGASQLKVSPLDAESGGGFSAEIFFVRADYETESGTQSKELVVRRELNTYPLFLDGDLRLQGRMLAALNQYSDIPVPEFIGMEMDKTLLGAPFLVMGRVHGEVIKQHPNYNIAGWLTGLTPRQRLQAWTNAIEAFAKLHQLNWHNGFAFLDNPARGQPGLDQYLNWFAEWHRWTAQGREQPVADAALAYVLGNRPQHSAINVLWGDPHQSNVMFNADATVAALIDWELAALGPGEIDLAYWLYFDEHWSDLCGVQRLQGLPDRASAIAIYESAVGRRVENLAYYAVIASLRMVNVARRTVDRQIGLGRIKADSTAGVNNIWTLHLARLMGMDVPEIGGDFHAFMAAMSMQ